MKNTRRADFVMGLGFIALAVFWFLEAHRMIKVDSGLSPGDYPKVVAVGLFILGLVLSVSSLIRGLPPREGAFDRKGALRLAVFFAVTVAYVQLMRWLGFILLTPFYLFFAIAYFGYKKRVAAAVVSVGVTAAIHGVFRLLFQVMLPEFRLF
jgi:Ca2+/Na+ antiporter